MLNRLSGGNRPVLTKVKELYNRRQLRINTTLVDNQPAGIASSLECRFSSSRIDPKTADKPRRKQQSEVKLTFSPIIEPPKWHKKPKNAAVVNEKPDQQTTKPPQTAAWITECSDLDSLEGIIFRAEGVSDLLDILAKNVGLISQNEISLILLVQRLSSKIARAAALGSGLEKPLTIEQRQGIKWLLGVIPGMLERNLTPPMILSTTRLLSSLYAATQYTDALLQTVTKQVFTRVADLVKTGQYDQNPELLLLLVKEFVRIHYSPRQIVDKIAKYISNNEVSFLTSSLQRHAVLSFFSAVEMMWKHRKHAVLDAGTIFLENKLADVTNILCMVVAQHPSNKSAHFLNSTIRLQKMNLPTLSLAETVKLLGVLGRLQTVWGQRQVD